MTIQKPALTGAQRAAIQALQEWQIKAQRLLPPKSFVTAAETLIDALEEESCVTANPHDLRAKGRAERAFAKAERMLQEANHGA